MKSLIRTGATPRDAGNALAVVGSDPEWWAQDPIPEIEEFEPTALRVNRGNRRLGVVVALAAGIVGLGLAGHWSDHPGIESAAAGTSPTRATLELDEPGPSASVERSAPLFTLLSPKAGTTITGGIVEVHGVARQGLGLVHLSVVLGNAVLGWTNVDVPRAGPVDSAIRFFAPSFIVPVELRVNQATESRFALSRSFNVDARGRVQLWGVAVDGPLDAPALVVDGFGALTRGPILITVLSDSRAIATARVAITREDLRPGSAGGRMVGLGSFRTRIAMPASVDSASLSVDLAWRDALGPGNVEVHVVKQVPARSEGARKTASTTQERRPARPAGGIRP